MISRDLLLFFLILISGAINLSAQDRLLRLPRQHITVKDFQAKGYILAIGGGGEGTIGRLKGSQVVAIDISRRELEEAPGGPLKIVMDARDMQFLNNTFNNATIFFTLMYIDGNDHNRVFQEVFRVLSPGGKLLIWDAKIPKQTDPFQTRTLLPLTIHLPQNRVLTRYRVRLPDKDHDIDYYVELAQKAGFRVIFQNTEKLVFHLILQKP